MITGALGLLWLVAWLLLYRLPESHPWITEAELRLIQDKTGAVASGAEKTRWIDLLRLRQTWGLFGSRFLSDPVWLPK